MRQTSLTIFSLNAQILTDLTTKKKKVMKMKEGRVSISIKLSTYDKLNSKRRLAQRTFDEMISHLLEG